ncbi:MAG: penicillin-insensitive murein endopeptidase [Alphaproteobacteria bacterium]|nr:penicillin-insensitive murein endopeptidase [Alphaproteobacteria bacterium]MDX5370137.1 penicillin-insensitive murein endopeptidase [Alphaproteobacteria bacterium]MDX5464694.1 penicillin-insensitive murein endopeptidase [Alphaproteobacteria bacterium]
MASMTRILALLALLAAAAFAAPGTLPAHASDDARPAKEIFGSLDAPSRHSLPAAIGSYARGCVAGAVPLAIDGPNHQAMRLSRNRNWGHPALVSYLEDLAAAAPSAGWPGLLVGDISQPRGGPMLTGHASHQIGLDADIWLRPMPDRRLTRKEREEMSSWVVVRADRNDVDPTLWSPAHTALIGIAARDARLARIFVNPAIKRALCREAGADRAWLSKVRPWWGHDAHFHVRLACPEGADFCRDQPPPPPGDGCGAELDWWFSEEARTPARTPAKPKPPITLADLPEQCRDVVQDSVADRN